MTGESYLSTALIPLLMTVVLAYYSFRLLVLQDVDSIYGKNKKKIQRNIFVYRKKLKVTQV